MTICVGEKGVEYMLPTLENKSNKDRGNTGFGVAISYFSSKGCTVLLPLNDTQPYDLVADIEGTLYKIQVKTTSYKERSGSYTVALRTTGGNKSNNTYKFFNKEDYDLLFIYCANGDMYLIPSSEITTKNSLTLSKSREDFKVTFE